MNLFRQILNTKYSATTDMALFILRLFIGAWMLSKGLPKVAMFFSENSAFPAVLGMSSKVSLGLTLFAQVVCSVLLIAGAGSRFAALVLGITMLVAVVVIHAQDPFVKAEPALHFLLVYVVLLLTGSGKYSIDYTIRQRSK